MGYFTSALKRHSVFLLLLLFAMVGGLAFAQCPTVSNLNQSFCDLQSPTISSLAATPNGNGIGWYATATSTTSLSPTLGLVNGEDYFADDNSGTCGTRPRVVVTIFGAPTGLNFQGVCVDNAANATIANLQATGNNIRWYAVPSGDTALPSTTVLNDNTIYYASQTNPNTGCETSRLSVFVNVGVVPTPTGPPIQYFCNLPGNPPTVANLQASGDNNWYLTSSSAVVLDPATQLINGQSYYATTVDPPCESLIRLEVMVVIQTPNNAGTSGIKKLCQNQLSTSPPINLFASLGGTPSNTGVWSGPLPTTNGFQGSLNVSTLTVAGSPYVFTYTVSSESCAPQSSTVTVIVLPPPTVSIAANATICSGTSSPVTFTGTPNATVVYTVNGTAQTIVLNNSGTAILTDTYTTTTSIQLVSATLAGTPGCTQSQSGNVVITVIPLPTATISANATICSGQSATVTFTGTPDSTVIYIVNGNSNSIVLNASGTATIVNTYTATTTFTLVSISTNGTPSCSKPLTGSVVITVVPPPVATISASSTICSGQSATVTFSGTPNATVTYTINGDSQTILLNSSGTAVLTNSYTATTVISFVSITTGGMPSCSQNISGSVTITVAPLPTVTIAANSSICSGQNASVTFTGTPNATVTYTINDTTQTIVLNASGTAVLTDSYTATTTITLVSITSSGTPVCPAPVTGSVVITVVPLPTATVSVSPTTICSGQNATMTFSGTPNATVTYTLNGTTFTITLNASGTAILNQAFSANTTITIVSASVGSAPACSQPLTGSASITIIPLPAATISQNATICSGQTTPITITGTPNSTVAYSVNGTTQTIVLGPSGSATVPNNYTVTTVVTLVQIATNGTPSCSQFLTGSITITVQQLPIVSIATNSTICGGQSASVTFTGTPNAIVQFTVNGNLQTIALNAAGTAVLTGNYNVTTTIDLVNVSTAGTPSCSQPQNGTVIITVVPPPTATISVSPNSTICANSPATVTIIGTPNATVVYTVNGSSQTVLLNNSGVATITDSYTATTTFVLISVTSPGTPSCTQNISGTVTINVSPLPTAILSASTSVCSGQPTTITVTGTPNATVNYTLNGNAATIILNASGSAQINGNFTQNTTIILVSASISGPPACSQNLNQILVITVVPLPNAGINGSATLCANSEPINLLTILGPNAQTGGTWSPLLSGGNIYNPAIDAPGIYSYTVQGQPPCPSASATVNVTVNPIPNAGTNGNATFCSNGSPQNLFQFLGNAAQSGGTWSPALASGSGIFNPAVDLAGVYTYTVNGSGPCSPASAAVTVTITPRPNAGNSALLTICANSGSTNLFSALGTSAQMGGTWSPMLASGTGIFNPAADAPGSYTYTVIGNAPCANSTATVTVNVNPVPNAGNDATVNLCSNADPQDLYLLLGADAQPGGIWSPALASGTGIFNPNVDTSGIYTYTITGTPPCSNDTATVTVMITPGPDAGISGTAIFCPGSAPQDLFQALGGTPQTGGTWSPSLASGSGIFNPTLDSPGVYTYTFSGNQPCDDDSATVTVIFNPEPNAGEDGTAFFCSNFAPADLFASLNGNPQAGGTWTPALASGTGIFNPMIDTPGVYTYSAGGNFCSTDTATVTVSVTQAPNAGGAGATLQITTCETVTSIDLTTALNGSQGIGVFTDNDNTGALSGNIFNPSIPGEGTYNFTYTVTGGTSPCLTDTATVTVIVNPVPSAGNFSGNQNVCISETTIDLFTLLNNAQTGGIFADLNGNTVPQIINFAAFATGIYSYVYSVTNSCGNDSETVQFTILPNPILGAANVSATSPVCQNTDVIVTITGLSDGNYSIVYNLSGANIMEDTTANLPIANGTATFTIPGINFLNMGATTINFISLTNSDGCSSLLSNISTSINIVPQSSLDSANIVIANICIGANATIVIQNAVNLADGSYTFDYTVSGANAFSGTSAATTITTGSGQFTIAGANLSNVGSSTVTITDIQSTSENCVGETATVSGSFTINPLPSLANATITVGDTCVGFANVVTISNVPFTDFTEYNIIYQLSGPVVATQGASVVFLNGTGFFSIPNTLIINSGIFTITIVSITSVETSCGSINQTLSTTFRVGPSDIPVLINDGDIFCNKIEVALADIEANFEGNLTIIWYDSAIGDNVLPSTTIAVFGTTYYASSVEESGCESGRLPVTIVEKDCDELLIPDGFSPNGDGINDFFVIKDIEIKYPNFTLEFFNRYGNVLYKQNRFKPNWDGTSKEKGVNLGNGVLPVGVYFYILEFGDGLRKPLQGRLYLNR